MTDRDQAFERHFTATAYIVHQQHTLLLWHHGLRMWLPPGGHCEANEDPVQAVVREAKEESGLDVCVLTPGGLPRFDGVEVLPPPAVILVEDIVRDDQPFHQHIDHVYFTAPRGSVDFARPIPHGPHQWVERTRMEAEFSLKAPDGSLVPVADDVRLLGLQALVAARET